MYAITSDGYHDREMKWKTIDAIAETGNNW